MMNEDAQQAPIGWFRDMAPYINLHRGSTFVIMIPGDAQMSGAMQRLRHDIALLASLGVHLVLVYGSRAQTAARLAQTGASETFHAGLRVTEAETVPLLQEIVGAQSIELQALLSMSLPNSPMQGAELRVSAGNFVRAQPLGVVDGVDYQFTGRVRSIDAAGIRSLLDSRSVVLLSSLGYSLTGETFNLSLDDVAVSAAQALGADKLILMATGEGVHKADGTLLRQCTAIEAESAQPLGGEDRALLATAARSCRAGVPRTHIVSYSDSDALLTELFTTDGSGTLVTQEPYERSRWANISDVGGVLEMLAPLEASGVLRTRSRELLESEIGNFRILERDGRMIACAALYPFVEESCAELACIVTHPDYRGSQRAQRLLTELEAEVRARGLRDVFVLTTQTAHWFIERGFEPCSLEVLPPQRQALYNLQRNSKVLRKTLTAKA